MAKRKEPTNIKEQFKALKNLPEFFSMIWQTNPYMAVANVLLRLIKSAIPLVMLYIGKEIIDEVIRLYNNANTDTQYLWVLVGLELGLAVFSDLLNRAITLLDSLLGDLFVSAQNVVALSIQGNKKSRILESSKDA